MLYPVSGIKKTANTFHFITVVGGLVTGILMIKEFRVNSETLVYKKSLSSSVNNLKIVKFKLLEI